MPKKVVVIVDIDHAEFTHGKTAARARRIVAEHGADHAFREPNGTTHLIAESQYAGAYDQVVRKDSQGRFHEITAFQPKEGILSAIFHWLTGKGAKQIGLDEL